MCSSQHPVERPPLMTSQQSAIRNPQSVTTHSGVTAPHSVRHSVQLSSQLTAPRRRVTAPRHRVAAPRHRPTTPYTTPYSYLLNCIKLKAGQALFLAANEPHAYVTGETGD